MVNALVPPRWDEADEHFAASLRACEEGDARLAGARTHIGWGNLLALRGNAEAARDHFERAAAQFQVSGLVSELGQAQHVLKSLSR